MVNSFTDEYNKLYKQLYDNIPDEESWFFPALKELIEKYDKQTAIIFATQQPWPEYTFELLVKAGLTDIDKEILIPYLKTKNEDNCYCIAFCLAACGYQEGFVVLKQFAKQTHLLSKHTHPFVDILPDLIFIKDDRISEISIICKNYNKQHKP
ncbi:hypothetical protein SAMN05216503_3333 [Polaribacter sp. KT25b]|uniref:hypothetical protein n=1 Tax=Polaribacter sp. KT25b TaxID=1855336 RepID=UPI00087D72DA|nr:hypothetical protein [Polaribacter sp. KT25b]SDS52287.1 hypothetical protein SAMN05216503_3333 [Polaribacter sp. KT25b]